MSDNIINPFLYGITGGGIGEYTTTDDVNIPDMGIAAITNRSEVEYIQDVFDDFEGSGRIAPAAIALSPDEIYSKNTIDTLFANKIKSILVKLVGIGVNQWLYKDWLIQLDDLELSGELYYMGKDPDRINVLLDMGNDGILILPIAVFAIFPIVMGEDEIEDFPIAYEIEDIDLTKVRFILENIIHQWIQKTWNYEDNTFDIKYKGKDPREIVSEGEFSHPIPYLALYHAEMIEDDEGEYSYNDEHIDFRELDFEIEIASAGYTIITNPYDDGILQGVKCVVDLGNDIVKDVIFTNSGIYIVRDHSTVGDIQKGSIWDGLQLETKAYDDGEKSGVKVVLSYDDTEYKETIFTNDGTLIFRNASEVGDTEYGDIEFDIVEETGGDIQWINKQWQYMSNDFDIRYVGQDPTEISFTGSYPYTLPFGVIYYAGGLGDTETTDTYDKEIDFTQLRFEAEMLSTGYTVVTNAYDDGTLQGVKCVVDLGDKVKDVILANGGDLIVRDHSTVGDVEYDGDSTGGGGIPIGDDTEDIPPFGCDLIEYTDNTEKNIKSMTLYGLTIPDKAESAIIQVFIEKNGGSESDDDFYKVRRIIGKSGGEGIREEEIVSTKTINLGEDMGGEYEVIVRHLNSYPEDIDFGDENRLAWQVAPIVYATTMDFATISEDNLVKIFNNKVTGILARNSSYGMILGSDRIEYTEEGTKDYKSMTVYGLGLPVDEGKLETGTIKVIFRSDGQGGYSIQRYGYGDFGNSGCGGSSLYTTSEIVNVFVGIENGTPQYVPISFTNRAEVIEFPNINMSGIDFNARMFLFYFVNSPSIGTIEKAKMKTFFDCGIQSMLANFGGALVGCDDITYTFDENNDDACSITLTNLITQSQADSSVTEKMSMRFVFNSNGESSDLYDVEKVVFGSTTKTFDSQIKLGFDVNEDFGLQSQYAYTKTDPKDIMVPDFNNPLADEIPFLVNLMALLMANDEEMGFTEEEEVVNILSSAYKGLKESGITNFYGHLEPEMPFALIMPVIRFSENDGNFEIVIQMYIDGLKELYITGKEGESVWGIALGDDELPDIEYTITSIGNIVDDEPIENSSDAISSGWAYEMEQRIKAIEDELNIE